MDKQLVSLAIFVLVLNGHSGRLLAQQDDFGERIEEVIITAERREQSLQDVPVAISAMTGESMERAKIMRTDDLAGTVPNFNIGRVRLGQLRTVIRGIGGRSGDSIASNQKVAMFVDDIFLARGTSMDVAFFDVERVEILRGPQGTLYGKNAVAGALNVISKKPDENYRAKIEADVGNYETLNTRVLISGEIAGNTYGKVILGSNKHEGYVDNIFTGNKLNEVETYFGQVKLRFTPGDWDILLGANFEHHPDANATNAHVAGSTGLDKWGVGPIFSPNPDDPWKASLNRDGLGSQDSWSVSAKAIRSADDLDWTYITGYVTTENKFERDLDASAGEQSLGEPDFWQDSFEDTKSFSHELRITSSPDGAYSVGGKLFWTVGLYYFHEEGTRFEAFHRVNSPTLGDLHNDQGLDIESDSLALYGQGTYALTEKLNVTLGLRYSYEEKTVWNTLIPDFFDVKVSDDWSDVSPKLSFDYSITDDVMVYVSYGRGFLSGAFNAEPESVEAVADSAVDPEKADNYEIGIKGNYYGGSLQLNATYFYIDYQDLQVQDFDENARTVLDNAASAVSKGIEIEAKYLPSDNLMLSLAYGYIEATYDEFCVDAVLPESAGPDCVDDRGGFDASGNSIEYSPKYTLNFGVDYTVNLAGGAELSFRGDYIHKDTQYFSSTNVRVKGQRNVDLFGTSVRYATANDNWYVSLWGRNLTNAEYKTDCLDFGSTEDSAQCMYGAPRTFGLTVTYNAE